MAVRDNTEGNDVAVAAIQPAIGMNSSTPASAPRLSARGKPSARDAVVT